MNAKNLFATVLTYAAPSSNYRGESEENRTVLQKISKGGHEYTVISPESMRNALREILARWGLPMNRSRLHNEDQLAVAFKGYPDAATYADDFLFGYMVADKDAVKEMGKKKIPAKRDSVLRMNLAVAVAPYRFDATFHQSPLNAAGPGQDAAPWKNSSTSALLHREVAHTAYQYPIALHLGECAEGKGPTWTRKLLEAIGQLTDVAGGHARSYFEMAPRSVVARLTPSLVAGYDTYGFDEKGDFTELKRVLANDLPAGEFWLGGELVRKMPSEVREKLTAAGATLDENPQRLLAALATAAIPGG
jgi:CRISPR-associated protein Cst2